MNRRPLKRLLILPAVLIIGLVVGLQTFQHRTSPDVDAGPPLGAVPAPPHADEIEQCTRATDDFLDELGAPTSGDRVTSEQVLACPAIFDSHRVTYIGELVGDLLERDGGAWVLVNDDAYALAVGPLPSHGHRRGTNSGLTVWLPNELHDEVTGLGRPNHRGDVVELQGTIVRTDPADGGGLTLRADTIRILSPSEAIDEPLNVAQIWLAATALLAAATLSLLRRTTGAPRR